MLNFQEMTVYGDQEEEPQMQKTPMCPVKKLMGCQQGCPSGWKHVGTTLHGCCYAFGICNGSRKFCEKSQPCPTPPSNPLQSQPSPIKCPPAKKMGCKQNCPSGWKHVGTSNYGCCVSFGNCGGLMKTCKPPCTSRRRLVLPGLEGLMDQMTEGHHEIAGDDETSLRLE